MQFVQLRLQKLTRIVEDLQCDGLVIVQDSNLYKFTSDSVLLANFFKAKKTDEVVELCAGSGVISILGTKKTNAKQFYCFEIQKEMCDIFKESTILNKIENIKIFNENLIKAPEILKKTVDVVVVNPPYYTNKEINNNKHISVATHELETNLEDICKISSKLLKFGGKLYMVHVADRLAEICFNLKKYNLEPKKVVLVKPTKEKPANTVLIEATKGAKVGLKIDELICQNADGSMTTELKKIYGIK